MNHSLDGARVAAILAAVGRLRPRVHCLTNTVAQNITANMLLACGAVPSMASHPGEVGAVAAGAGAILINLGTISPEGERAIPALVAVARERGIPLVLDPVFVELSPLRLRLAEAVLGLPGVTVRGNATEMAALAGLVGEAQGVLRVTTGKIDRIEGEGRMFAVAHGHEWMTKVTGLGCAASALVAACRAVEPDAAVAAAAALTAYGIAGEIAAGQAAGPGSFAMHLIDALAGLNEAALTARIG
ncbi:hydroxyethylthiazole kinase [Bosea sp. (in: a-proteobacteria)]|uniref:hydroxyethylthiazole kinase n=1 Tax=Bosea sp. (in: a-proteobacteria) TaxID=1871050 RepID=UPI002610A804|nr:hydroxyethylthiazole kinase [Bosea sp. (in: a-proteobacteria)]MCO5090451.1 hydroxyethylthiazole kinase [Bosea sp. (in: a-proteobacteria)]